MSAANLLTATVAVVNGEKKRADRLCQGDFIIFDDIVWEVTDADFVKDNTGIVELRLLANSQISSVSTVVTPRFREYRTVYVVIKS